MELDDDVTPDVADENCQLIDWQSNTPSVDTNTGPVRFPRRSRIEEPQQDAPPGFGPPKPDTVRSRAGYGGVASGALKEPGRPNYDGGTGYGAAEPPANPGRGSVAPGETPDANQATPPTPPTRVPW